MKKLHFCRLHAGSRDFDGGRGGLGGRLGTVGAEGIDITNEGIAIATATFTVKDTVTSGDTVNITLGDNENTKLGAKLHGSVEAFVPDVNESSDGAPLIIVQKNHRTHFCVL